MLVLGRLSWGIVLASCLWAVSELAHQGSRWVALYVAIGLVAFYEAVRARG